jgi:hypothetical protein
MALLLASSVLSPYSEHSLAAKDQWRRSTQKNTCSKPFLCGVLEGDATWQQMRTKLSQAVIPRVLMLFSITDSTTRSFSAGRVTARQRNDAWPRQRVNRMEAIEVVHTAPVNKEGGSLPLHSSALMKCKDGYEKPLACGGLNLGKGRGFSFAFGRRSVTLRLSVQNSLIIWITALRKSRGPGD